MRTAEPVITSLLRFPQLNDSIQVIEHTHRDVPKELREFVISYYQDRLPAVVGL